METVSAQLLVFSHDRPRDHPWRTGYRSFPAVHLERPRGGTWRLEQPGRADLVVDDGHVVVVPADRVHGFRMASGPRMHSSWALVRWEWLPGLPLASPRRPLVLPPTADPFDRLNAVEGDGLSDAVDRQRILLDLLSAILAGGGIAAERRPLASRLQSVLRFIDAHLHDPDLDRDALAAVCRLSATRFHEVFTREIGQAPMRFLAAARIRRARTLLVGSDLAIGHIAERCGFASPFYFSRAFKRAVGQSPSEYRSGNRPDR